ncbi:MAG: hypothetical protein RI907_3603 [Pseudomonadota bacterium]|jgi:predicted porin
MKQASLRHIALAVLATTATLAQAQEAKVYGAIGLDLRYATGVGGKSVLAVEDNAIVNSRVGIKGGEDLGGGLKAEFNLESSIAPDTGAARAAFWNRNAFVGLKGDFGSVRVGHQWNVADDYMCGYFVCAYYAPFLLNGFNALSDYYDNTIKYTSPTIGGFQGGVSYTLGEQPGKDTAGQKLQGAVNYGSGPFAMGVVLFSERSNTAPGSNTMYALGASYDLSTVKFRLGVAKADKAIGGDFKATLIDLGVDVPLSATTTVSADYVIDDVSKGGDDLSYLRLRGTYALSKRTSLNCNAIFLDNSGQGTVGFAGATNPGKSQTILTAGITHSF